MKRRIAILIPAYNEEKVLPNTLEQLVKQISPRDIYVVSDQSTDTTEDIARFFKVKVLRNKVRSGKTMGIENAFKHFRILARYKHAMVLDADTYPLEGFFDNIFLRLKEKGVACVCGQVLTQKAANIFVYYRSLSYFVWQNVFKNISSAFGAVPIAPGTASVYRTSVLRKIALDKKIFIEDFDMTFQVHRKKLGRIIYEPKAKIVTQDPDNLADYVKQMTRWQIGHYQTMRKHGVPFQFKKLDIVVLALLLVDISHIVSVMFITPAMIVYTYFNWQAIGLTDPLILAIFLDMWILAGIGVLQFLATGSIAPFLLSPVLWLVQYLNVYTTAKALHQTFFTTIYGAWASPTRRIAHST
jgi:poly-beta-1,6-N-acetyl-D-glucosamine synthase